MNIAKVRKTSLLSPFNSTDTTFTLKDFVDHKGNALALTDFESLFVVLIRQGSLVELVLCDGLTQNADGSALLTVATNGRDLSSTFPYTGGSEGEDFSSNAEVVNGDDPYTIYQITKVYTNSVAFNGAPDASETVKGLEEVATVAQIDAGDADGSGETSAPLGVTASRLKSSIYKTQLPDAGQKVLLDTTVGMIFPYVADLEPTGFLKCNGQAVDSDSYPALSAIIIGKYGYGTGATFTAATSDIITASAHPYSDGDILFFANDGGALPAGLAVNTLYYVRDATTNTFKVETTIGGGAVDITGTGSGTHYLHNTFKVPDLRSSFLMGIGQKTKAFTFVDGDVTTGTDQIVIDANDFLRTGQAVVLSTSGTLPVGLSAITYYIIEVSAGVIKLATSRANADDGTAVDITDATGGGTHTLTLTLTNRALADEGGEEEHTLQTEELASHAHGSYQSNGGTGVEAGSPSDTGDPQTNSVTPTGSDTPHNNLPPYVAVNYIIKT